MTKMANQTRDQLSLPDIQLIRDHLPLVKSIARRLSKRLPPSVAQDDLFCAGALGLVDSVVRRRGDDEVSFGCYTRIRIRGAIFDELRAHDWLPRRSRAADHQKSDSLPRPVAVVHFDDLTAEADRTPVDASVATNPHSALAEKRMAVVLKQELGQLPERDRLVLHLHYFKGMRLREIGRLLGVSEARISQIHHRALGQLKPRMLAAA